MKFRTEIEPQTLHVHPITHDGGVVMLGSCFTDNIGTLLERDGLKVVHNLMGPLYNPASLSTCIFRAIGRNLYTVEDLVCDPEGAYHCLDFASRYSGNDPEAVLDRVNSDLLVLTDALLGAFTIVITLGTAWVFRLASTGQIVGNCHKLHPATFVRERLSVDECADYLCKIIGQLPETVKNVVFTVSPVRHTADTLHGNQLSKATLLLAIDRVSDSDPRITYFPAYEIMLDDLRDYRFYATDMKHPSDMAVEYIYNVFADRFFTASTKENAVRCRKEWLRHAHIPINE